LINIDIKKSFKDFKLEINLEIKENQFVAIKGKSGSGKTTLLRILAGLEEASGEIIVDNEIWLNKKINLPPQKREIGFVFQNYALFENMSVEENLLFVNNDKKLSENLLEVTGLISFKNRNVKNLSGGQKQRVNLCRALMKRPKLLLLDEPLSALDNDMRINLQNEILTLHKEFKTTTLMVSHDLNEIYKLSDRIIEINQGKIIDDLANQKLIKDKLILKAEVLDIKNHKAILFIDKQIIEIENKGYKIGDFVELEIFSRDIKV